MSQQLAVRLPDDLLAGLDEAVTRGRAPNRAAAVRAAVAAFVAAERRRAVGEAIAERYRRAPQTDEEVAIATAAALRSILEEPW